MKPSITALIRRAVELEGGKSQVNIAQARELIRCFAVAFSEASSNGVPVWDEWFVYTIQSFKDHLAREMKRKSQRKQAKRKKK